MAILQIRVYPDPVLLVRCLPVDRFDEELRRLAGDLVETMHAAPGVGLAAPQVGVERRLAVVDLSGGSEAGALHILVNPEILESSGLASEVEGCLSIPEVSEKVDRPQRIRVRAQDLEGRTFEVEGSDWLARAVCHEVDHLDGILFIHRLRGLRRQRVERLLRRQLRRRETPPWTAAALG